MKPNRSNKFLGSHINTESPSGFSAIMFRDVVLCNPSTIANPTLHPGIQMCPDQESLRPQKIWVFTVPEEFHFAIFVSSILKVFAFSLGETRVFTNELISGFKSFCYETKVWRMICTLITLLWLEYKHLFLFVNMYFRHFYAKKCIFLLYLNYLICSQAYVASDSRLCKNILWNYGFFYTSGWYLPMDIYLLCKILFVCIPW